MPQEHEAGQQQQQKQPAHSQGHSGARAHSLALARSFVAGVERSAKFWVTLRLLPLLKTFKGFFIKNGISVMPLKYCSSLNGEQNGGQIKTDRSFVE